MDHNLLSVRQKDYKDLTNPKNDFPSSRLRRKISSDIGKRTYSARSLHGLVVHELGLRIVSGQIAEGEVLPIETQFPAIGNWKGSGLVLLVDDDETVLQLGQEMLSRLGFEVISTTDGSEALEKFTQHGEDLALVLLDLTMPGLSGEEVYAGMQDLDASIPVIMSSGYTEQDVALRLGDRGLRGFLQKPYTLDQLQAQIYALIGA
ncbi:MAG: hypothetical protein COB46_10885 [Rhodospirillaceae bacterium]|nr:MAG: hypothetical protein COB46_10885 [Rhodospirillaceae bacterium]